MIETALAVPATEPAVEEPIRTASRRGFDRQLMEMVVHDLQNPLAGILAFLEILKDRPDGLTSIEERGLQAAQARCHELSELVLTLLQLGRGELGVDVRPIDLEHVARTAAEAFAPVAEREKQELRFKPAKGKCTLTRTDERIVQRILYNLTRNALRHPPAGTTVELAVETDRTLQIVVQDDGPGISREIQHRVFDPGALRRAGVPSDSGVGLAFSQLAAECLGMSLRFEERAEGGCRFTLRASEAHDEFQALPGPDSGLELRKVPA